MARLCRASRQPTGISPLSIDRRPAATRTPRAVVARGGVDAKLDLRTVTLDEAEAFAVAQGWPRFRGEQIWRWVHDKGARSFDDMTNLGRDTRARLAEAAVIGGLEIAEVQTSHDGTRKLRLVTRDGQSIESVIIPDGDKTTQCISSQVGCAVDCAASYGGGKSWVAALLIATT